MKIDTFQEHIASKHTKHHEHVCQECGSSFAHRTNYVRHLKLVHQKGKMPNKKKNPTLILKSDDLLEESTSNTEFIAVPCNLSTKVEIG